MIRNLLASTAIATLVATGAYAQTAMPEAAPMEQTVQYTVHAEGHLASNIIGEAVYNSASDEADNIGSVTDIIIADDGSLEGIVVGVGGFLGIGQKSVAVEYNALEWAERDGDRYLVLQTTREQLEALPDFDTAAYEPQPMDAEIGSTHIATADELGIAVAAAPDATADDDLAAAPDADATETEDDVAIAPEDATATDDEMATAPDGGDTVESEAELAGSDDTTLPDDGEMAADDATETEDDLAAAPADDATETDDDLAAAPADDAATADDDLAAAPADEATDTDTDVAAEDTLTDPDETAVTGAIDPNTLSDVETSTISADEIIGTTVYGVDDENVGSISDVILTGDGEVDAVVLDVGGFLGIGSKEVAVDMDNLSFLSDGDGNYYLYTQFTQEQLEAQPEYDSASFEEQRDDQLLIVPAQ